MKTPYDEGMFACQTAKGKWTNPYQPNSQAYKEWNDGYEYALSLDDEDHQPTDEEY